LLLIWIIRSFPNSFVNECIFMDFSRVNRIIRSRVLIKVPGERGRKDKPHLFYLRSTNDVMFIEDSFTELHGKRRHFILE